MSKVKRDSTDNRSVPYNHKVDVPQPTGYVFDFGKYQGKTFDEVASINRGYFYWCEQNGLLDQARHAGLKAAIEAYRKQPKKSPQKKSPQKAQPANKALQNALDNATQTSSHVIQLTADMFAPTPKEQASIDALHKKFQPWLLKACNKVIDKEGSYLVYFHDKRKKWLNAAVRSGFVAQYPLRPVNPVIPSSPEVDEFRTVLAQAPSRKVIRTNKFGELKEYWDVPERDPGFQITHEFDVEWGDSIDIEWGYGYMMELRAAIAKVGIDVWKSLRWELYDKYLECANPMHVTEYQGKVEWHDPAFGWLQD